MSLVFVYLIVAVAGSVNVFKNSTMMSLCSQICTLLFIWMVPGGAWLYLCWEQGGIIGGIVGVLLAIVILFAYSH
jgi:hypothetical protein